MSSTFSQTMMSLSPPLNRIRIPGVSCGRRENPAFTMSFRSRLKSRCKPVIPIARSISILIGRRDGGARRIRTDDILLAKQALYQLSYGPSFSRDLG